ncbi:MAG TPA: ATP-binding protein [Thermoanaerobaculia bacterium]|nr:ATP-binding protein [Thermoanaerobaculia bacterium]
MAPTVRARLTLWYCAVLGAVLAAFAGVSYFAIARAIRAENDASLADTGHELSAAFERLALDESGLARTVRLDFRYSDRALFVFDSTGRLAASSRSREISEADRDALARRVAAGARGAFTIRGASAGGGVRAFAFPVTVVSTSFVAVVARNLDDQSRRLRAAAAALFSGIPLAILAAGAGGYVLARKSLSPVLRMSRQARRIGASSLGERIVVDNPRDELGTLAETLNELLARLEAAFASQRRFMADASHELRTPLAILQAESDVALSRPERSPEEYREALEVVQKTSRKLSQIVEDLFLVSRTDAGDYPVRRSRFYLDETIAGAARAMRRRAEARGVRIEVVPTPERLVWADEELIHRLAINLIDNAVKHTREGGCVRVDLSGEGGVTSIRVTDEGAGVPLSERDRIFERFYRGEKTDGSGAGLGLAIVRSIAQLHGGDARLADSSPAGSTFVAELRIAPDAA